MRRPGAQWIWRLLTAAAFGSAVVTELRKPASQRTWHGKVANVVPYDFRKPTPDRLLQTYWQPDGPIVSGKVWGVGWSPNLGAMFRLARRLS